MSQTKRKPAARPRKGPDPAAIIAARAFLARASKSFDVVGARLYGSRARGDYRSGSDIDLAVFLRGARADGDLFRAATDMGAIAFDVLDQTKSGFRPSPSGKRNGRTRNHTATRAFWRTSGVKACRFDE